MVGLMRFSALLLLAACSNPDNIVVGGIGADPTNNIPVAFIDNVRSGVSFVGSYTDQNGNKSPRTIVVLSNTSGLCDQLGSHPDYFRKPPEAFVALIFFLPVDRVGTFFIGSSAGTAAELIAANLTAPVNPYFAPSTGRSYIALSDVAADGSNARGSFDLIFVDKQSPPQPHEFYGRYKVGGCSALANALLP
jgi:hypothetical protein